MILLWTPQTHSTELRMIDYVRMGGGRCWRFCRAEQSSKRWHWHLFRFNEKGELERRSNQLSLEDVFQRAKAIAGDRGIDAISIT
jgi:hypothetical protein